MAVPFSSTSTSADRLDSGLRLGRLPGLDGIRAIAAAMVVVNHHDFTFVSGALGVTMFFVLSGFLITWLLLGEAERHGTVSLRDFYMRRLLRIFPAFYAFCALVIGLAVVTHKELHWPQTIASLLYVNNYYEAINGEVATPLSHSWSLAIEEQFYLLWPLAFLLLRRNRATMARALAVTIVVVWVYRATLSFAGVPWTYIHYAFDTRADHLLVGCLLAVILRAGYAKGAVRLVSSRVWLSIATVLALEASVVAGHTFGNHYKQAFGFAIEPVLIAALIVQVIALRDTRLWRWLNWRSMTFLGTISYSIYLYQQIVAGPVSRALDAAPAAIQLVVSAAVILVLATGSYLIVERPFLRLKQRYERSRRNAPAAALSHPATA
jgi:peptidoglycan/LPS O-acetylase OafA/YrhL